MPEPVTATIAVIGAAASFQASRQKAAAARQEGKDIQAANEFNAEIQRRQALEEERKAVRQSQVHRAETRKVAAGNIAALGKGGTTQEGSPLLALQKNAESAELDNFLILREGKLRKQAASEQGKLDIFKGKVARKAGSKKGKAILLSGKAKLATNLATTAIDFKNR